LVPGEGVLGAFPELRKASVGSVVSVCPRGTLDGFGMKFDIWGVFKKKSVEKMQHPLKSAKHNGTLHEDR